MFQGSTIEISSEALQANLAFIGKVLGKAQLCSVVKGNAYGHGINVFTPMAAQLGVTRFAVYSASEAWQLHGRLPAGCELFIMGDVDGSALEWAVEQGISFSVFDNARLEHAIAAGRRTGKKALAHLEVETGMHRTGFEMEFFGEVLQRCKTDADAIEVAGICTHLAGAENRSNAERVLGQKVRFREALAMAGKTGSGPGMRHAACSAVSLNEPDMLYDMARIGILQYGFWPNRETQERYSEQHGMVPAPLRRVVRWWGPVTAVSTLPAGGFVGYGATFNAEAGTRIATIPMGYAYGYARSLSNAGQVLIRGQLAPVRGIVNMNCITVDVTGIEGVEKGDEAVLIGAQGERSISVASFGDLSDQLNYELLTRLPHDIPRVVVEKHI